MKKLIYSINTKKFFLVSFIFFFFLRTAIAQFEEQTSFQLPLSQLGAVVWGDINNDGLLDIIVSGNIVNDTLTIVYKNIGNNTFTELTNASMHDMGISSLQLSDINKDGYLDIFLTSVLIRDSIGVVKWGTKIYNNNGNETFTENSQINIPSTSFGKSYFCDFNNDGFLDVLLNSCNYETGAYKLYINNGDNTFSGRESLLPAACAGSIEWGDYNNDGFSDILITGFIQNTSEIISKVYKNNGNETFSEQTDILLTPVRNGSGIWGDYNNDGFLDILLIGETYSTDNDPLFNLIPVAKIYKNEGDGTFTEQKDIHLAQVKSGSASWGDYNNDGNLDIILTGDTAKFNSYQNQSISKVYKNNGDETFTEQININLTPVKSGSVSWGDYNNDGLLDILLSGYTSTWNPIIKIYKNIGLFRTNTAPSQPTSLQQKNNFQNTEMIYSETSILQKIEGSNSVALRWDKANDGQTPQNGLTYNVRIGSVPSGNDIVSPMASINSGILYKPSEGNAGHFNNFIINNLPNGIYYWSVQAVDNGFLGGAWAIESTFTTWSQNTVIEKLSSNNNISIYPNPTKDFIQIVRDKGEQSLATITDLNGRVLINKQIKDSKEFMDLTNYEDGIYILKLTTNVELKVYKLVKAQK